MNIAFVEIKNFRKLKSCRIDLSPKSTIFVGANNSGKTSAMFALMKFLKKRQVVLDDFTITNQYAIKQLGEDETLRQKRIKYMINHNEEAIG